MEGLFLDQFGHVRVDEHVRSPRLAAEVLVPHPDPVPLLTALTAKLERSAWSDHFRSVWRQAVAEMHLARVLFTLGTAEAAWIDLADQIRRNGQIFESNVT